MLITETDFILNLYEGDRATVEIDGSRQRFPWSGFVYKGIEQARDQQTERASDVTLYAR